MYEFNHAWPPELQEAERRRYRAVCKVRCLTASLDRIGPEEFEAVMNQIEEAQAEVYEAGYLALNLKWKWATGCAYQKMKKTAPGATNTQDGIAEQASNEPNHSTAIISGIPEGIQDED